MPTGQELDEFAVAAGVALLCGAGIAVMGLWLIYEMWR